MKNLLFIYNPKAGKGKARSQIADIVEIFDRAGYQITIRPTRRKGDTARQIYKNGNDFDRIIISGGDGTLNEALAGLRNRAQKGLPLPELGYLPAGSTNDFAVSLGIPADPVRAARIAVDGTVFSCDCGDFNGVPFAYVAAFGAFTKVSYATPQQTKNSLGHVAYVLEGIKSLPQIKGIPVTVQTEDETLTGNFLYGMVSNSHSVGGLNGFYGKSIVSLDDGLLEVVLVKEPKTLADQSELMADLLRLNLNSRHIIFRKVKKISFLCEKELDWTLDGEYGGSPRLAEISAVPDAYKIVVPHEEVRLPQSPFAEAMQEFL